MWKFYIYRDESFHHEFSHLGEMQSIIPDDVKMMALTATATMKTKASIIKLLDMQKPVAIYVPPLKDNIIHAVTKKISISQAFEPFCTLLATMRTKTG